MLNIFSLIGICLNSAIYSSRFFFAKLPEAYAIFNPIVDIMPIILILFSLSLCLASYYKFSMKSLILY